MVRRHHDQIRHPGEVRVHLPVVQPVGAAEELEVGGAGDRLVQIHDIQAASHAERAG